MGRYRTKPVEKEAFRYGSEVAPEWFRDAIRSGEVMQASPGHGLHQNPYCLLQTLEGEMRAEAGDYIIQGLNGEIYPCKPDIFEKTYEEVKP